MESDVNKLLNGQMVEYLANPDNAIQSAYEQLRPTERVFVDAYVATDNPRGAMIRAFPQLAVKPSAADPRAMEYMKRPLVKAAIAERLREISSRLDVTAENVLREISKLAMSNMADYVRITDQGEPFVDLNNVTREQMAAVSEVTVEDFSEGRGEAARDVRKVKFKLHDKGAALDKLARSMGLYAPDRLEISGPDGAPIETRNVVVNMSVTEAAEMYSKTLRGE